MDRFRGLVVQMFGRDKKKEAAPQSVNIMGGRLQELCGSDDEIYVALSRLLLLDPKKISPPIESFLSEAQDYELKGNRFKAEVGYRIAGSMSLWNGDSERVRNYFTKASLIAGDARPEYGTITKRANDAVAIARKYYEVPEMAQNP